MSRETSRPVSMAALGVGRLGLLHAQHLARRVAGAHLRVVVDIDPDLARKAGEACGVDHTTDVDSVLSDSEITAVEICTATDTHADLIVAAAHAGKHIFCEKPIAVTLPDADRAVQAAREANVLLQIGFMRRYDPSFREAKRLIDAGHIGTPVSFRSQSSDGLISPSRDFLARNGGIFLDVGVHDFDMARWMMNDEVVSVYATGAVLVHQVLREFNDVDHGVALLHFQRGGIGIVQVNHTGMYGYDIVTEVGGDRATVRAGDVRDHAVWLYDSQGRVSHDTIPNFPERFAAAYLEELIEFVRCVQHNEEPDCTGEDARAALAISLAARQSLREGHAVVLGPLPAH